MAVIDAIDEAMIALLRSDARIPVSELAQRLHIARGTAQARLGRLLDQGAIRRFTVELDPGLDRHLIRAISLVQLTSTSHSKVVGLLGQIPGVQRMHTTNGSWDLVLELAAGSLSELDRTLAAVRGVNGVSNTETSILLTTL